MNLGDIKGAFLEAGPIQQKFRPLYMHQPRGGIPDLDPQDVIEITGNIYMGPTMHLSIGGAPLTVQHKR